MYQAARWADPETKTAIEIRLEPRASGRAICSGCGQAAAGYDRLTEPHDFNVQRPGPLLNLGSARNPHVAPVRRNVLFGSVCTQPCAPLR